LKVEGEQRKFFPFFTSPTLGRGARTRKSSREKKNLSRSLSLSLSHTHSFSLCHTHKKQITTPREPAPEKPEEPKEAPPPKEAPEVAPPPPPATAAAAPAPAPAAAAAAAPLVRPEARPSPSAASPSSVIRIDPATLNFVDGCSTFYPSGFNIWEAVEMGFGARNLWAASLPAGTTGPALLRDVLDSAAAAKFNVMRILSHGVNKESDMTLNGVAGKFNENVAKGLDYVVAEAGKRGIRSEK